MPLTYWHNTAGERGPMQRLVYLFYAVTAVVIWKSFILLKVRKHTYMPTPENTSSTNIDIIPAKNVDISCPPMKTFIDDPLYPATLLASFPGSGNTWLRHLLETATGIFTGSLYNETEMEALGFQGERYNDNRVLVVKTHVVEDMLNRQGVRFNRVLLLLRNPVDCFVAEINRRYGRGHTRRADPNNFKGQRLDHIMQWLGQWWRAFIIGWLVRYRGEIHVVRYEELLVNTTETMRRVLHFLGTPVTSAQLSCMMKLKEGPVHRHNHSHPSLGIYEKRYNSLYAQIPLLIKRRKYHGLSTSF